MTAETTVNRPLFYLSCTQPDGPIVYHHPQRSGIQGDILEHDSLSLQLANPGLLLPVHPHLVPRSLVSCVCASTVRL